MGIERLYCPNKLFKSLILNEIEPTFVRTKEVYFLRAEGRVSISLSDASTLSIS